MPNHFIYLFWLLFSNEGIQNILILSATVAPFASVGIRPVVNRLNQDTTVYYCLVFCLFSWPYMVKLLNSGITNICIDPFQVSQLVVSKAKRLWTRKKRTKRNWPKTITVALAMILSLILRCNNSRSFDSNVLLTTSDRSLYFVHF